MMDKGASLLRVNVSRLLENLDSLAQIGRIADGGVSRPAFSAADVAARSWFREQVEEAKLEYKEDGAGNLSAILPAANPAAKTLLTGSHLDTVPNGGRFDGSLGVLCALEALQTIKEANIDLTCHLETISFSDEVVTSIVGIRSYWLRFVGKAAQLETTPMADRGEALHGAAVFVQQARFC